MISLVIYPDERLTQRCATVTEFGPSLAALASEMAELMYASGGIGLAAPQVGATSRIVVMDPTAGAEANQLLVLVNPEVTWRSPVTASREEGCLSLPGVLLSVTRPEIVRVDYDDLSGTHHSALLTKSCSRIAQHEIDHLDGVTVLDRAGRVAKKLALKSLKRRADGGATEV